MRRWNGRPQWTGRILRRRVSCFRARRSCFRAEVAQRKVAGMRNHANEAFKLGAAPLKLLQKAMDFLALPEGKVVELLSDPWDALDPMSLEDLRNTEECGFEQALRGVFSHEVSNIWSYMAARWCEKS